MRTDLQINYNDLESLSAKLHDYYNTLDKMEASVADLKAVLEKQKSYAVYELLGDISGITYTAEDKKNTITQLKQMLDDYITDMKGLLSPVFKDKIVRADKTDVWYNIGQIESPIKDIKKELGIECSGNYHTIPAVESVEEQAKRLKEERNYTKLENFRKINLMSFARRINDKVADMWEIYNLNIKPFEETDDEYRKSLNRLYKACTDTGDKILDGAGTVGKVVLVFLEAVAAVLVGAVVLSLLPGELVVGLILAPIVGCIVLAAVPEEYVPNWLKDEKEKSDNIIKTIKGGPVAIVEAIGQGLADTVQTPEGIASVAGTVTGLILTFGLAKKIKSNVKTKTDGGGGGSGPKPGDPNFVGPLEEIDAARAADWIKPDGSTWWPPNQGAVLGTEQTVTLPQGTVIGRIGGETGSFVAPPNTPPEMLSLRPGTDISVYNEYRVIMDIPKVQQAEVAAWFDMPGGGIQYELPASIQELVDKGYIELIFN